MKYLIVVLVLLVSSSNLYANSCSCVYKSGYAKQTTATKKHWWGTSIQFYCDYDCTVNEETQIVRARHSTWWTGDEEGNEFVCDGTIYEQKYSVTSGWFYYAYAGSKPFKPGKSSSPDLKLLAKENDCR